MIQTVDGNRQYCLASSNQSIHLSSLLEKRYHIRNNKLQSVICPSGTSAIHLALMATLQEGQKRKLKINLFYGDELYSQTPKIFKNLANLIKINLIPFNVTCIDKLLVLIESHGDNFNIVFIESATNPSGNIFDYKIIRSLKKRVKHLKFIVDNTWLTSVIFNPFTFGADLVVLSLTKYYSAGTHIGGAILGYNIWQVKYLLSSQGWHVSPKACEMMNEALTSLDHRIQQTSETTKKIVAYLRKKVFIRHCSLETDISHGLSNLYYKGSYVPGVISLIVNFNKEDAIK